MVPGGWATAVLPTTTPRSCVAVGQRPPQRDDPAPVVTYRDDRSGDAEGIGEATQVGDPLRDRAWRVGPLGEPHPEVVGGDDAPALRGRREQSAPQVGPGGVAVHAEQGPSSGFDAVVEQVPVPRTALRVAGRDACGTRPGRARADPQAGPSRSRPPAADASTLRSPADLQTAGVEPGADPHQQDPVTGLQVAHSSGQRERHGGGADVAVRPGSCGALGRGRSPAARQIASVWTCEIWCMK